MGAWVPPKPARAEPDQVVAYRSSAVKCPACQQFRPELGIYEVAGRPNESLLACRACATARGR